MAFTRKDKGPAESEYQAPRGPSAAEGPLAPPSDPPIAPAHAVPPPQPVGEAGEPLRDPVRLNGGEIVSYVRQLSAGEDGWDPNKKMVLIQHADLRTEAVPLEDISKDATIPVVPRSAPNRVDAVVDPTVDQKKTT